MSDNYEEGRPAPLSDHDFEALWAQSNFKDVVRGAATGDAAIRYRRIVMEGRVAEAQDRMVTWTKWAVVVALTTSTVSTVTTTVLALAGKL